MIKEKRINRKPHADSRRSLFYHQLNYLGVLESPIVSSHNAVCLLWYIEEIIFRELKINKVPNLS